MNLSQLFLNPLSQQARVDLSNPYDMHRTIRRAFPDYSGNPNRILFRVETEYGREGRPMVLVQSSSLEPDWSALDQFDQYLLDIRGPKRIDPHFKKGQVLRFRLDGNPTVKRKGKRRALLKEEEQQQWLERKIQQSGAELGFATFNSFWTNNPQAKEEKYQDNKAKIPHFGIKAQGMLRVQDPERIRKAIEDGLGPAKSFGFGLLSLAPAR